MASIRESLTSVSREEIDGLIDVQEVVNEYGTDCIFFMRKTASVVRDNYRSIKQYPHDDTKGNPINFRAWPVIPTPTEKELEHAGIKENMDVVIWTSMMDWMEAGIDVKNLIETTVVIDGIEWEIKNAGGRERFHSVNLYNVFGLVKTGNV